MAKKMDREVVLGFVEEARNYIPKIRENLDRLRKDPSQLKSLEIAHRFTHTIKGASSMVGYSILSHIAYFVEEALEEIGAGQTPYTKELDTALRQTLSHIERYLEGIVSGDLFEGSILSAVTKIFRRHKGLPESGDEEAIRAFISGSNQPRKDAGAAQGAPATDPGQQKRLGQAETEEPSSELLEAFVEEAGEHLQTITRLLSEIETAQDKDALLKNLRRGAHTLKGVAGMVGFPTITKLTHRMEDVLDGFADGRLPISPDVVELLLETADAVEDLINGNPEDADLNRAVGHLYERYTQVLGGMGTMHLPDDGEEEDMPPLEPLGEEKIIDLQKAAEREKAQKAAGPETRPLAAKRAFKTREMIRIPQERLEELVRLVSELVISRSTFEQYFGRLVGQVGELRSSIHRMRRISNSIETQYEVSVLGGGRLMRRAVGGESQPLHVSADSTEFDELEMDRYTAFHSLSRELTETIGDMGTVGLELHDVIRDFESYLRQSSLVTSDVQDKLMKLRMVPLGTLTTRMRRTVRVTAAARGKAADLVIEGEDIELEKKVLEDLADPLLHILRNAIDHGIEPPELRSVLGKPERGTIHVRAHYSGTQIILRITDDGAGLEPELIRNKAIENGFLSAEATAGMVPAELYELIFLPGFSTAGELSEVSGRGVGMDIVQATVAKLKGTISLDSKPGRGLSISLRLPLTLAITRVLLVTTHGEMFAIPLGNIQKILRMEKDISQDLGKQAMLQVDGTYYTLVELGSTLRLQGNPDLSVARRPVLILEAGERQIALVVDKLVEAREVVVKNLGGHLKRVRAIAGATIMGDGSVVLILNPPELIGTERSARRVEQVKPPSTRVRNRALEVLIVDDSLSVRKVLSNLVDGAGWRPLTAKDGVEALEIIQRAPEPPDILLLDIEMPRMDGYELTSLLRNQPRYKDLPIVILTSRAAKKHREKAFERGATDYLVKPFQGEALLDLIRRLTDATKRNRSHE